MADRFVSLLMGSDSDYPTVKPAMDVLDEFGIPYEVRVTSAHRAVDTTHHYVKDADSRGCQVFIAAAGMAAHLAGSVAAVTTKPVIGVPIDSGPLQGFDALLSTAQMPEGVPVAAVSIGRTGSRNAGILSVQIMALSDEDLAAKLLEMREQSKHAVLEKNSKLQSQLDANT